MTVSRRGGVRVGLLAVAMASSLVGACGTSPASGSVPGQDSAGTADVYAALGASETFGDGAGDQALRFRAAWPQLFYADVLSRAATYYNFGIPGITVGQALTEEVPAALAVHPTVVTAFFNLDDLARGVSPTEYGTELEDLVRQMRQGGRATVLVANSLRVSDLPAYRACLPGAPAGVTCLLGAQVAAPPPDVIDGLVDQYNAEVTRVAGATGAVVVDLHSQSDQLTLHPEYIASDGLHPSALGHAAIAALFEAAYKAHLAHP